MTTQFMCEATVADGVALTAEDVHFMCQTVHEGNRAWCVRQGDHSQACWEDAPDWQKSSCLMGIMFQLNRLDQPSNPAASHNSWSVCKIQDGWVYGAVKDEVAKTHPCLVSFDKLPPEQQFKDSLFEALTRTVFNKLKEARA